VAEVAKLRLAGPITMIIQENPETPRVPGSDPSAPVAADLVGWYAAYTWVHHEKRVARHLAERDVDCFLPLYRSLRRWKDRRKELDLALFPGYIFVRMALRDRLQVLQLPSVVHLVKFRGLPVQLPANETETLRRGLTNEVSVAPHPYLKIGRRVGIVHGPLVGTEGILSRKKDQFRVVLSVDLIMRSVAIEVEAAKIEIAN